MDRAVGTVGGAEPLLVPAGRGDLEPDGTDDRGAEHRSGAPRLAGDVVGDPTALEVRGVGERHEGLAAVQGVTLHDGVAHGVDLRVARAVLLVNDDAAALPHLEAGGLGERGVWSDADGSDDDVRRQLLARGEGHPLRPDLGDLAAEPQVDAGRAQRVMDDRGHLRVERRHDLVGGLDDGDAEAAVEEVLGDLEADEAAADDDRGLRARGGGDHGVGVLDVA